MPLYEYECEICGKRFEQIQKFSDPPAEKCLACGGPVHKLMSLPAIQFKGSGWYVTDYARKGQAAEAAPDTEKTAKSGGSAERGSQLGRAEDRGREKGSPSSDSTSSSAPATTSTGSTSSDS